MARQSSFLITQHLTGPQLVERQMHWNIISKNYAASLVRMRLLQIDHIPAIWLYHMLFMNVAKHTVRLCYLVLLKITST